MIIRALFAAVLLAVASPVLAAAELTAGQFLARAEPLLKKNKMSLMFSGEARKLVGILGRAAQNNRTRLNADMAAGRKVECPLLALWGEKGVIHRLFTPLADWAAVARDVRGRALPSGHYLPEEAPDETYAELAAFFTA